MGILTGVGKSKPSPSSRKKQWAGDLFTGLGNDFVDPQILEVLGSTNERVEGDAFGLCYCICFKNFIEY